MLIHFKTIISYSNQRQCNLSKGTPRESETEADTQSNQEQKMKRQVTDKRKYLQITYLKKTSIQNI